MSRRRDSVSGTSTPQLGGPAMTSVQVAVRIRPLTSADQSSIPPRWQKTILTASASNSVTVEPGSAPPSGISGGASGTTSASRDKRQAFSFDRVFAPGDGQAEIFTVAEPLIDKFMEGYNVTILAYGQTSSGKSYTMGTAAGDDIDYEGLVAGRTADPQMGIIPRAVARIFSTMKLNKAAGVQYQAKVSFIEIYNEDLIDLLGDAADGDARPHVQIREGKNGQIIWSGLREVKVNNVAEVMNHLLQGTSVRRTNETDMNAQSSRSHAIFSITLTQKKWVGSGPPPHAGPPSAYSGRSTPAGRNTASLGRASGIPMAGRVASPAFGRRTPSGIPGLAAPGASARHSTIGLRSASAMDTFEDSTDGEWVTAISKFHFVDLAGSERLKRTAAQGERVKEGISINSGLHALGNVISALGDPSKAKRTTHVPYRDSKLTRLLQDSLGGNAHTLMIACVSPTEYNVSETINTLQYANRARNIKNKAELNEVEVGWDDIDYLQTLVQKLRKELSIIKGASKGMVDMDLSKDKNPTRAAQKEILSWQDKYASLSQKHSQLTAEVTKLRSQLDPKRQEDASEEDFFKAAEPIIVEYEKSIDALEGQLNLTKAALAYVEDLANEREAQIEQQSSQLEILGEELESKESTVADLQSRLNKLQERESSAEVYARELETRLEAIGSRGDADSAVLAELHKEIAQLKEKESTSELYIKDLEAKLHAADESNAALNKKISDLEADVESRDESYRNLLSRFELLDSGKESKAMAAELEAKEVTIQGLEERLSTATSKHEALSTQHAALSQQHEELARTISSHEEEKDQLSQKIKTLEVAAAAAAAVGIGAGTVAAADGSKDLAPVSAANGNGSAHQTDDSAVEALEARLESLQEEMRAVRDSESGIRAELELANRKYKESLREINDLNTQLTELKLSGAGSTSLSSFQLDGGEEELEVLDSQGDENRQPQTPVRSNNLARRSNARRPESLLVDTTNRQSPAAARLTRRSSGSFLGYNKSDGTRTPGAAPSPHNRTRSVSQSSSLDFSSVLQSQLSQTRGPRPLSLTGSVPPSPTLRAFEPDSPANYERKVTSLEREAMRLQQALKERDEEIQALEASVRASQNAPASVTNTEGTDTSTPTPTASDFNTTDSLHVPGQVGAEQAPSGILTPATEKEIDAIRRLMAGAQGDAAASSGSLMLDDLMRSMARKETQHREQMEAMSEELMAVKKQNETLEALSRDQVDNMSLEIQQLRAQLVSRASKDEGFSKTPNSSRSLADELQESTPLEPVVSQAEVEELKQHHASILASKNQELEQTISRKAEEHQQAIDRVKQDHDRKLALMADEHASAMSNAEFAKQSSLASSDSERQDVLAKLQEEHQSQLAKLKEEHEVSLLKALEAQAADHQSIVSDFESKLASRENESKSLLESIQASHARTLEKQVNEHAGQLESLQANHRQALDNLRAELEVQHLSALTEAVREAENKVKADHAVELDNLSRGHARSTSETSALLTEMEAKHAELTKQMDLLKADHANILDKIKAEHSSQLDRALIDLQIISSDREETRKAYEELHAKHQDLLNKMDIDPHEVETLRSELADTSDALVTLEAALTETQEERDQLLIEMEMMRQSSEAAANEKGPVNGTAGIASIQTMVDPALKRELETHKSMLSKTRADMVKLKAELQAAREEGTKHEQTIKDLQLRLATSETRSIRSNGSGSFGQESQTEHEAAALAAASSGTISPSVNGARSPMGNKRSSDYEPGMMDLRNHRPSLGAVKPPPPTPPPNMPPPPTPIGNGDRSNGSSIMRSSAGMRTSTSSQMTRPESPTGGITRSSSVTSMNSPSVNGLHGSAGEIKLTKLLAEQAEEIKNLAKQLNHCEADLQANIDLVATLEAALNDSERNLRKSRVQLAEVTRERERYATEANEMRSQLNSAQSEVENVRNSVMLEKQGYESKIEEERQAKERARKALEARLEEVSKRKNSKLFCL